MFRRLVVLLLFVTKSWAAIVVGNPAGQVTLTMVYDYQCPHCHQAFPVVQKLLSHNADLKLRLMPVAIINHTSLYEAAAAIASTRYQGKFQTLNAWLMAKPPLTQNQLTQLLKALHLQSGSFIHAMHSKWVQAQLAEGLQLLQREQAGTPLFIIYPSQYPHQATVLRGYQTYSILQQEIDNARSHVS